MGDVDEPHESWLRDVARVPFAGLGDCRPGDKVGRYRVERTLGRGGMGIVYLARDEQLGRDVALKVLDARHFGDADRRKRFLREAHIAAQLAAPTIATVHDAGEDGARLFLAMEHVPGETLRSVLDRTPVLPLDVIRSVALEIATALGVAHRAGIVHRDLKPDDVMVMPDGHIKMLDFGVAKIDRPTSTNRTTLETALGAIIGTPAYMSPEQAKGREVDARSDIFSFGVLLYELVAGPRPFSGATPLEVLVAIDRDAPASLSRMRPETPRALARIIERCLAKAADARYASADELALALRELSLPSSRRRWALATAALVLSVVTPVYAALDSGSRARSPIAPAIVVVSDTAVLITSSVPSVARPSALPKSTPRPSRPVASVSTSTSPGPLDEPK